MYYRTLFPNDIGALRGVVALRLEVCRHTLEDSNHRFLHRLDLDVRQGSEKLLRRELVVAALRLDDLGLCK